jgi:hypothetical protein
MDDDFNAAEPTPGEPRDDSSSTVSIAAAAAFVERVESDHPARPGTALVQSYLSQRWLDDEAVALGTRGDRCSACPRLDRIRH